MVGQSFCHAWIKGNPGGQTPTHLFKILLVGESGSGKTAFLQR